MTTHRLCFTRLGVSSCGFWDRLDVQRDGRIPLALAIGDAWSAVRGDSARRQAASRWVHDNAMSPDRYLPETMGPGVAFFDYDNDGWMDIFLVNSGAMRFLHAEDAAQERSVQEQPRWHVHRCHRQSRRGRRHAIRHGRAPSPTTTTTDIRTSSSRPMDGARSTTTTATARSLMSPTKPESRHRAGRPAPSGSTTTTTASSIFSFAASSSSH